MPAHTAAHPAQIQVRAQAAPQPRPAAAAHATTIEARPARSPAPAQRAQASPAPSARQPAPRRAPYQPTYVPRGESSVRTWIAWTSIIGAHVLLLVWSATVS